MLREIQKHKQFRGFRQVSPVERANMRILRFAEKATNQPEGGAGCKVRSDGMGTCPALLGLLPLEHSDPHELNKINDLSACGSIEKNSGVVFLRFGAAVGTALFFDMTETVRKLLPDDTKLLIDGDKLIADFLQTLSLPDIQGGSPEGKDRKRIDTPYHQDMLEQAIKDGIGEMTPEEMWPVAGLVRQLTIDTLKRRPDASLQTAIMKRLALLCRNT